MESSRNLVKETNRAHLSPEDVNRLIELLNQIWIGNYKLRCFLAKSSTGLNVYHKSHGSQSIGKDASVKPCKMVSYADKGVELTSSSDDSWSVVEFSSKLSEEEIGGGCRLFEIQNVGSINGVNALTGRLNAGSVDTFSLVGSKELGCDKEVVGLNESEDCLGLCIEYNNKVITYCLMPLGALDIVPEKVVLTDLGWDSGPTLLQDFSLDVDCIPIRCEPVRDGCLGYDSWDFTVSKSKWNKKEKRSKKKNKKSRKSNKKALDLFRVEDEGVVGISDYFISDDDIRHPNEVILKDLRNVD
ncbi:hypothetical protein PTKIN_Ptkin14bG0192300 [Pterospermum kingtungense]